MMNKSGSTPEGSYHERRAARLLTWCLYLGLALLPWVLLYGLTALLFNNGTWWTGTTNGAVDWIEQLGGDGSYCVVADARLN